MAKVQKIFNTWKLEFIGVSGWVDDNTLEFLS